MGEAESTGPTAAASGEGRAARAWLLPLTTKAFEEARRAGLAEAGVPARDAAEAAKARPGDAVVVLLVEGPAFAASFRVAGAAPSAESGAAPAAEGVPPAPPAAATSRISVRPMGVCPVGDLEIAAPLAPKLALARDWPVAEWRKAPLGVLREITFEDADQVRWSCRAREKGKPRPPGAAPTEAERPPRIPSRFKRPGGAR